MRIEHVAIWCKDIELMKDFYETYFLAEANDLYINPAKGFKSYFLSFPESQTRLELMTKETIDETSNKQLIGLAHLAFKLSTSRSVDELTELIASAGFKHIDGPRTTGDGYYESTILDPEGNTIEITC